MQVKGIIKRLEQNKKFQKWRTENYASSLVHIFKMLDKANKDDWQIGFYNPNDTITTFIVSKNKVETIPESEIFKKPEEKIMKLTVEDVKLDMDKAIEKAKNFQETEYPKDKPVKEMVILQKLNIGQIYNITFITQSLNTLNIKIDSKNGKIVKHGLISLMDLKSK